MSTPWKWRLGFEIYMPKELKKKKNSRSICWALLLQNMWLQKESYINTNIGFWLILTLKLPRSEPCDYINSPWNVMVDAVWDVHVKIYSNGIMHCLFRSLSFMIKLYYERFGRCGWWKQHIWMASSNFFSSSFVIVGCIILANFICRGNPLMLASYVKWDFFSLSFSFGNSNLSS